MVSSSQGEASAHLIELIGYLKNEALVDLLTPFANHHDPLIRTATVMALSSTAGEKSISLLSKIVNEESDDKIRDLANSRLQKLKGKSPSAKE